jgi:hypothetical protein
VFAPVYGLASAASGQAGDLGNLRRLFEQVERRGGRYVATLPILAAFLDEPCVYSPYSPVSRMFWNELYLDLAALAGELGMAPPAVPPIVAGARIDYRTHYHWRRQALDPMAERLFATRGDEIDAWAAEVGAYDYAAFRAGDHAPAVARLARCGATGGVASRADAIALMPTRAVTPTLPPSGRCSASSTSWRAARSALPRPPVGVTAMPTTCGASPAVSTEAGRRARRRCVVSRAPGLGPAAGVADRAESATPARRLHFAASAPCGLGRAADRCDGGSAVCVPGHPATAGLPPLSSLASSSRPRPLVSSRARCARSARTSAPCPDGWLPPAMARHGLFRIHVVVVLPTRPGSGPSHRRPSRSRASMRTAASG